MLQIKLDRIRLDNITSILFQLPAIFVCSVFLVLFFCHNKKNKGLSPFMLISLHTGTQTAH